METLKKYFKRYFIDAMSAMALGLFSSLIIGLVISQIAKIPMLGFLEPLTEVLGAKSPVVGAAIGAAVSWGLKPKAPLVIFSCAGAGAIGYAAGGPVGAYIAAIVGNEAGSFCCGKTGVDIIVAPLTTIIPGGLVGMFVGGYVNEFMTFLGSLINSATELSPLPMGIAVSVIVGCALTAPISSAALCIMLDLNGLAAGAATVGCCTQMIGFAVAGYRDTKIDGLISVGIGTSMLQFGNIMRKPQIWIAPTLASAILGPVSTCIFKMTNTAAGAGMGTSGLVGQFGTIAAMAGTVSPLQLFLEIALLHFILPALLTLAIDKILYSKGWVKDGDMALAV